MGAVVGRLRERPVLISALAAMPVACGPGCVVAAMGGGFALEVSFLALLTVGVLMALPPMIVLFFGGDSPFRFLLSASLVCVAVSGIALGWYNALQESYFMEDCFSFSSKEPCLQPRYRWYDVVYEFVYRDTCMMARIHEPGTFLAKERYCYEEFRTRWPLFFKSVLQCLGAACVIGAFVVLDSTPLMGQKCPDEAGMLLEAHVEERQHERCVPQSIAGPSVAALDDR
mmetsp:Transcript_40623/g.111797  ORF Transcript_40623/g.111797 Transcript_40623/m.111797 type:complete len:228 (-) Transcript_40623:137-820(-)|eukprot:CAMPEP_0117551646 /NCGR_PEP_ID=MMETSP0784-20121206/49297_1 /TAXON_ID=39447 /ORGANISM="" /LENGTH=227 /DNA_ID=CAMNT_0005348689 /DNA_START=65 /DNA_END=748 /DNA_ORIENTATION=-